MIEAVASYLVWRSQEKYVMLYYVVEYYCILLHYIQYINVYYMLNYNQLYS